MGVRSRDPEWGVCLLVGQQQEARGLESQVGGNRWAVGATWTSAADRGSDDRNSSSHGLQVGLPRPWCVQGWFLTRPSLCPWS